MAERLLAAGKKVYAFDAGIHQLFGANRKNLKNYNSTIVSILSKSSHRGRAVLLMCHERYMFSTELGDIKCNHSF